MVRALLHHLHPQMGPVGVYPRVLREQAEELMRTLSIIYQQFWLPREVPSDWRLENVTVLGRVRSS